MNLPNERIRALNDELRRNLPNAHAVITNGIAALGPEAVARIVKTVAVYDDFCHANDHCEEHDLGAFEADGAVAFFKIDYYDKALVAHSPDATDPTVTERVITIMLADEYRTSDLWSSPHHLARVSHGPKVETVLIVDLRHFA